MAASLIFIVIVGLHLAPGIPGAKIGSEGTKVTQPPIIGDQDESIGMYKKQDVHNIIRNHNCIGAEAGKLVQDSNDCTKYYVCDGAGHATETTHSCEDNHFSCFNPITGNCTQDEDTCEQICKPKCKKACDKAGDYIADLNNSSVYFLCLKEDSNANITHLCPPERQYFNGIKCVSNVSQSCTCQPQVQLEKCERNSQKIPDPNDCHAYYICDRIEDVFTLDGPHYCKPGMSFVNGTCMALDTDCTNICEPDPTMVTSPHDDDDESTSNIVSPSNGNECEDIWYPTNDYNYTCSDYRRGCTDRYVSYYEWMQAECKKTCGLCDQGSRPDKCNDRESRAYCEKNKRDCYWNSYVTKNCRLTCNVCDDLEYGESGPHRCKDRGPKAYCEANKRNCQYYNSIRENCKLTCNMCEDHGRGGSGRDRCEDSRPRAYCEANKYDCQVNYIAEDCKRTCNMCEDRGHGDIYYPNHDNNAHGNNYYNSYNYGYL